MQGLRQWSYLLKGTKIPILVFTDHANLRYYHDPQKIGPHVTGYLPEREQYNMLLEYKPRATNRADGLSHHPDYEGDNPDNNDVLVWPDKYFCEQHIAIRVFNSDSIDDKLDTRVFQAQKEHQLELKQMATAHNLTLDPEYQETWHHGTTLVVVADNALRRGVITLFHDHKASGHPGITKTLQLISPYYWWPNMRPSSWSTSEAVLHAKCPKSIPTLVTRHYFLSPQQKMPYHSKLLQWISSRNYHPQEDMTRSSPLPTWTALKCPSLSPVKKPSTRKELLIYSSSTWYHTTVSPRRSSLTETPDSPPSL